MATANQEPTTKRGVARRDLLRWFGVGAAASLVPFGYAEQSTNWLEIERHDLYLPRWDAEGFRVVLLSDFHAMDVHRTEVCEEAIRLAIAERPDAILLGGDYVSWVDRFRMEMVARIATAFDKARCPVLAVLGNHDYWSEKSHRIIDQFDGSRVRILRNQPFEMGGVVIGGVDDGIAHKQKPEFLRRYEGRDSVLALYHEPDFVTELPESVSVMFAGHSHGGQICLPGGIPIHTPKGANRYYAGYYPEAEIPLYVTRGIGTVGPDCRLFCRPEVSVLTLRKG